MPLSFPNPSQRTILFCSLIVAIGLNGCEKDNRPPPAARGPRDIPMPTQSNGPPIGFRGPRDIEAGRQQYEAAQRAREAAELEPVASTLATAELYDVHCTTCHGETGDADGPGAKTVYPLPRSFRTDRFKMVSSRNGLPDTDDFVKAIVDGMPGSSMPKFDKLHPDDQRRLAGYVLKLWRDGVRDQIRKESEEEGELLDAKTLDELAIKYTTANEKVSVPEFGAPDADSIQRGLDLYKLQSCASCHGDDYRGSKTVDLVDEHGQTIRPRDLENEPYKGGEHDASVFLRLRLGMPGTPHPSNDALSDEQLVDLVHAMQSIRASQKVILTGHQRRSAATVRDYLRQLDTYTRQ